MTKDSSKLELMTIEEHEKKMVSFLIGLIVVSLWVVIILSLIT